MRSCQSEKVHLQLSWKWTKAWLWDWVLPLLTPSPWACREPETGALRVVLLPPPLQNRKSHMQTSKTAWEFCIILKGWALIQWEQQTLLLTNTWNTNEKKPRAKLFIIKGIRFYFYTLKVKNMHFKIFTMTIYERTFVNETATYSTRIYPPNDKVYIRRKCNREKKRERGKLHPCTICTCMFFHTFCLLVVDGVTGSFDLLSLTNATSDWDSSNWQKSAGCSSTNALLSHASLSHGDLVIQSGLKISQQPWEVGIVLWKNWQMEKHRFK